MIHEDNFACHWPGLPERSSDSCNAAHPVSKSPQAARFHPSAVWSLTQRVMSADSIVCSGGCCGMSHARKDRMMERFMGGNVSSDSKNVDQLVTNSSLATSLPPH
jgi:hypothetical protein